MWLSSVTVLSGVTEMLFSAIERSATWQEVALALFICGLIVFLCVRFFGGDDNGHHGGPHNFPECWL